MIFKSLNEAAYSIIRQKILQGEYELGCRIREELLAEEIAISRTPVREAITRLVADGILIRNSRGGLCLIDPRPEEIVDNIDIRISLEKLSVEKCIERSTDEEIRIIAGSVKRFEKALETEDYMACNELDGEFHSLIARTTKNDRLICLLDDLSAFFLLVRKEAKKDHPEEKNRRTLEEHSRLAEAIGRRDVEAAKKAVEVNIQTMRSNLLRKEKYETAG